MYNKLLQYLKDVIINHNMTWLTGELHTLD